MTKATEKRIRIAIYIITAALLITASSHAFFSMTDKIPDRNKVLNIMTDRIETPKYNLTAGLLILAVPIILYFTGFFLMCIGVIRIKLKYILCGSVLSLLHAAWSYLCIETPFGERLFSISDKEVSAYALACITAIICTLCIFAVAITAYYKQEERINEMTKELYK